MELRALFAQSHIDLDAEMDRFDQRLNFMAARGLDMDTMVFSASFARNLEYYTGFVFEAASEDAAHGAMAFGEPAIGGGRYDRLLSTLGAKTDIPAVGAAIFTERLSGAQ